MVAKAKASKIQPHEIKWYGWRPDKPDHRDLMFLPHGTGTAELQELPPAVDLSSFCPPVMDQGALGSCTAHGITAAIRFNRIKSGMSDMPLSRLQLYYDERTVEGTVKEDAGAEIRDGIKCAAKIGVGHESSWKYVVSKFKTKPPKTVYKNAPQDQALSYRRVPVSVSDLKSAIASGFPVVIGISVYESFESDSAAKTGVIPMPGSSEEMIGGHCMLVIGYGQKPGTFTVRNSWGEDWGDKGNCYVPEEYLGNDNYGSDYWLIDSVG